MKKYKMISVNEEVYSKITKAQEELNTNSVVTYSKGSVIQLALEALRGGKKDENRNN